MAGNYLGSPQTHLEVHEHIQCFGAVTANVGMGIDKNCLWIEVVAIPANSSNNRTRI